LLGATVRDAGDAPQIVRVSRRVNRSIDDDAALQDRRDRVEALRTVVGEAVSSELLVARERRAICEAHLQLEISEPVERIRGTAGRDAAAVLRPRGCVLNVPEL